MNDAGGAILVILVVIALGAGGVLFGAQALERAAADRETARAERTRAEAAAYTERVEANTQAAAERATIREAQREAAHGRALELLPFVLVIAGAGLLSIMLLFVAWDLRANRPTVAGTDPAILLELRRLEAAQLEQWRAIAHLGRELPHRGEVVIYSERQP